MHAGHGYFSEYPYRYLGLALRRPGGTFYPQGLPQKDELNFAAQHFNSIELNGSFYSLQRPKSFQSWGNETPEDFVFSMKAIDTWAKRVVA
ncbi:MAG: DUF72 domain-containing protein [Terracidiphilus sp.]